MPYTPLSSEAVKLLDKESPVFKRFRLGTWLQNLLTAVATVAGAETLTNKTLTAPTVNGGTIANATVNGGTIATSTITSPDLYVAISSHDYAEDAADWVLSATEAKSAILTATNANGACAIVAVPDFGKVYWIKNSTGQELTIKADGQNGVKIANGKTAAVYGNATDFERLTADL
jgi:hypothetical protein